MYSFSNVRMHLPHALKHGYGKSSFHLSIRLVFPELHAQASPHHPGRQAGRINTGDSSAVAQRHCNATSTRQPEMDTRDDRGREAPRMGLR